MKRDIANLKKKTIEKSVYIKYFYPYVIKMAEQDIEIKLVYSQEDGTLDGIVYESKLKNILFEILKNFKEYDLPLTVTEYRKRKPEHRNAKVMFSKAGGTAGKNCFSTRACIPVRWLNEMGINPNDRNIIISFDGEKMIIEKRN